MPNSIASTKDVRKYNNDVGLNLPIVVTDGISFGNFQNIESAINWAKLNSVKNAEIILRGSFSFTDVTDLQFTNQITIRGDSGTLTIGNTTTVSNVIFKDLTLELFSTNSLRVKSNTKFINCTFTFDTYTLKGIALQTASENVEISKCIFNYNTDITPSNLVNSGNGAIYGSISSSSFLKNIIIKENIFNYVPTITGSDHPPFINIELTSITSLLRGVFIENNKFLNPAASLSLDVTKDYLAAIAIICTTTSTGVTYPTVSDVFISNNYCDNRQLFIITTTKSGSPSAIRNDFVLKNVHINNNTVGAIGFYTSANGTYISPSPSNFITDKPSGLSIKENTTTLIASMDEQGFYHSLYDTIGTGSYTGTKDLGKISISDNHVSFIHTGAGEEILISKNHLTPIPIANISVYSDSNDTAIYVAQKVSGSGNVTIESNFISQAVTLISGSPSTEDYGVPINILCNNQIINNIIKNIAASSYGINVGGLINSVRGNQLYRNSNSINAFIKASHPNTLPTSADGQITENFFDSATVDGSQEILDNSTIPSVWIYERNKNQTKRILASFVDPSSFASSFTTAPSDDDYLQILIDPGAADEEVYRDVNSDEISYVYIKAPESSKIEFRQFLELQNLLPQNTTLLNVRLGAFIQDSGDGITIDTSVAADNKFLYRIVSTKSQKADDIMDVKAYLDTPTTLQAQIKYSDPTFPFATQYPKIINGAFYAAFKTATQFLELAIDSSDEQYFVNNGDRLISIAFQVNFRTSSTGDPSSYVRFILSPLELKVRF